MAEHASPGLSRSVTWRVASLPRRDLFSLVRSPDEVADDDPPERERNERNLEQSLAQLREDAAADHDSRHGEDADGEGERSPARRKHVSASDGDTEEHETRDEGDARSRDDERKRREIVFAGG